eukprot:2373633-Pleurochrysis_carterae.AAC.1
MSVESAAECVRAWCHSKLSRESAVGTGILCSAWSSDATSALVPLCCSGAKRPSSDHGVDGRRVDCALNPWRSSAIAAHKREPRRDQ